MNQTAQGGRCQLTSVLLLEQDILVGGQLQDIDNVRLFCKCMKNIVIAIRGRNLIDHTIQKIEARGNQTNSLTTVAKDNMIMQFFENV